MSAGLWMLPLAVATMTGTFISPSVAKRVSIRKVITIGSLITALGFGLASFLDTGTTMLLVVVAAAAVGFGIGFSETLTNEVVLSTAPRRAPRRPRRFRKPATNSVARWAPHCSAPWGWEYMRGTCMPTSMD